MRGILDIGMHLSVIFASRATAMHPRMHITHYEFTSVGRQVKSLTYRSLIETLAISILITRGNLKKSKNDQLPS